MRSMHLIAFLLIPLLSLAAASDALVSLKPGDQAPEFSGLPGVDDQEHALGDYADKAAVVVVFTCNTCPYAVDVQTRLVQLQDAYAARGVQVVAICANNVEEDRLPAMKERAQEAGFNFPYLHDASQQVARAYGAITTPEFFVLDAKRRVAYHGALDDSPDGKTVTERYVAAALDAVLAGEVPKVQETRPVGCRVRYERTRRK